MGDRDFDTLLAKLAATPPRRPPIEQVGLARFELRRRLGGGGFGDVFEARGREHGNVVALKALRSPQPDWIYRFKREFRVVCDLTHPNLARVYELFCEHDQWYLTMELVDGLPFDQHVAAHPDRLRASFAQLARGVAALHRASCLHRDLKPSNALVEASGRVVLLDFGLAVEQRGPLHTAVAGTPPYLAPELGTGDAPSAASDWYAFGTMLYEALAGRLPYEGHERALFDAKRAGPPALPSTLRAGCDPELEALAMRLIAPAPEARPAGDEILAVLGVTDGAAVTVRRDDAARFVGRRPELAALDAALAASRTGPVVVTIHGHPGAGKTSLVEAFAASRRDDARVFAGRCHESETVPYKGIDGAIDALCADLGRLRPDEVDALLPPGASLIAQVFPVLRRVDAFTRVRQRTSRTTGDAVAPPLRELLARIARTAPLALLVDDLQMASDDGVELLLELLAPPALPVLVVVTYRREAAGRSPPLDRFLAAIAGGDAARFDVPVEALAADDVAALLGSRDGGAPPLDVAMRETAGHPYLLAKLLESGGPNAAPADLAAILAAELAELEPEARVVLDLIAIADAPLRPRVAFAAAGTGVEPAILDRLRRHRWIHRLSSHPDAELDVYHHRVREIVLAQLAPQRRRELEAALAAQISRASSTT